jgi:hypothetical protein
MAKQQEKLIIITLLKFNSDYITLNTDSFITFNQPRQCKNLSLVNIKNVNIISLKKRKEHQLLLRTSTLPNELGERTLHQFASLNRLLTSLLLLKLLT